MSAVKIAGIAVKTATIKELVHECQDDSIDYIANNHPQYIPFNLMLSMKSKSTKNFKKLTQKRQLVLMIFHQNL